MYYDLYIFGTITTHMLYDQIRYVHATRKLYKMRHMLVHNRSPEMGTRLGYPKYSKQFYRVKSKLREEGIIGSDGTFVESLTNLHLVMMPLRVDRAHVAILGRRVPYTIFLALTNGGSKTAGRLAAECGFSRKAVYNALDTMSNAGLVRIDRHVAKAEEGSSAREWLDGYLGAVMSWIDVSDDISVLFRTIPSCVGGPHAHQLRDYEPGMPMGSAEMQIFTYKPFLHLMESIVRDSQHFGRQPRRVLVKPVDGMETRWIDGVPYQKDAYC